MPTRFLECAAPISATLNLQIVPRILLEQANMTATGTAASSAAVSSTGCRCVCVQSDEQIYVKIGPTGTNATPTSYHIAAGSEQYFECGVGDIISIRT